MSEETTRRLADRFLNDAHESQQRVSLYLVSGFQLKGEVVEFDEETILFRRKDGHQLVMRSAVAVMYPLARSKGGIDDWWPGLDPAAPPADRPDP